MDEQILEKENKKRLENEEKRLYDQQTIELTKYRGILEYDFLQKKNYKQLNIVDENMQKDQQAVSQKEKERMDKLDKEKTLIGMINQRGTKQNHK